MKTFLSLSLILFFLGHTPFVLSELLIDQNKLLTELGICKADPSQEAKSLLLTQVFVNQTKYNLTIHYQNKQDNYALGVLTDTKEYSEKVTVMSGDCVLMEIKGDSRQGQVRIYDKNKSWPIDISLDATHLIKNNFHVLEDKQGLLEEDRGLPFAYIGSDFKETPACI